MLQKIIEFRKMEEETVKFEKHRKTAGKMLELKKCQEVRLKTYKLTKNC